MEPLLFIKFCENLLSKETNIYIINKVISHSIAIINDFIPLDNRNSQKQILFKLLSEKYFKHPLYEKYLFKNMTNYLLDLINSKDADNIKFLLEVNLEISIEDVCDSLVHVDSEENFDESKRYELPRLDLRTKERIVEAIYESDRFPILQKETLKRAILLENNNDKIPIIKDITFQTCNLDRNDDSTRKSLWNLFLYKDKKFSDSEIEAYMKGFNRELSKFSSLKTEGDIKLYFKKKFFKDFPYICKNYSNDYALLFYQNLRPTFLVQDKILKKFLKLKDKLKFGNNPNSKLKYLIENDIKELQYKLLVIKSYATLQLSGLRQNTFRKI